MNHGHPNEEQMQRYLARTLSEEEGIEIEKHFNNCEECRARLGVIVQSKFSDTDEQLEELTEQGREAAERARNLEGKGGMKVSDNIKTETPNPEPVKFQIDNLLIEQPGPAGTAVVDIEYRADDQSLHLDFSTRDGRPAVSIRFRVDTDTLVAQIEYGARTQKPNETLPLIKIG